MWFRRKEELDDIDKNIMETIVKFYVQNRSSLGSYFNKNMTQEHKRIVIKKIYDILNYSIKPRIKSDMQIQNNDTIKVYRGISASNEEKLKEYIEEFINGDMFLGGRASIYGTGIYTCCGSENSVANDYATDGNINSNGIIIESEISNDMKIESYEHLEQLQEKIIPILQRKYVDNEEFQQYLDVLSNTGVFSAILGIDAIYVQEKEYMVILNRGKMIVNDIEIYRNKIYESNNNKSK